MRKDCPYFHPGRSAQVGDGFGQLRRNTPRSSKENYPDRSAQAGDYSRGLLHERLQRSTSRSSRENDRGSPYPPDRPAQTGDGSNSFGQMERSTSRPSRENDRSSPADRLQGGIKRNIQQYETSSPEMHGTSEGNAQRYI